MRTIAAADSQILGASSGERGARVRVSVNDSGGTFRDLTTYPEENFVQSVSYREDIDSPGMTATIELKRAVGAKSIAPMAEDSPLNRAWNPATGYAALLELGREVKIEAGVTADLGGSPVTWLEVFRGYIDIIDWASESVSVECSGLEAKLRDTWIETERVYSHAQGASATKGCRTFELARTYPLNELVLPSEANLNGHFYKVTTAGTTSNTVEPTWPTGGGSTVVSGTVTFTEVGVTSITIGTAVETVLQQILDDNLGAGVVSLYVPTSPGWMIRGYQQDRGSLLDAVTRLADQIGWALRFKWDAGTSAFRLTFYDVDRAKTVQDATVVPSEVLDVSKASKDISVIRNAVRVVYSDTANRTPSKEPLRAVLEVTDATSISKYGRRFCEIAESSNSNIDTSAEAASLANAVLSDLKEPNLEWGVRLRFYPWLELADLLRFLPNGRHFSSEQKLAIVSVEHSLSATSGTTSISTRGKPSTGHARWLANEGRVLPDDVHKLLGGNPGGLATLSSQETVAGRRFIFSQDAQQLPFAPEQELHVSPSSGFSPSSLTLKAFGSSLDATVTDLEPGETYYVKTVPFRRNGSRLVRGLPSAETSFVAGRTKAIHYDSSSTQSHLPLNGNFEHASRDLASRAPDHWEPSALGGEGAETWGASGTVYYGSTTDHGRHVTLRAAASSRSRLLSSVFEVRRRLREANFAISFRRQGSSAAGKNLEAKLYFYSDAAATNLVDTRTLAYSGDSGGPYPSLNTWYTPEWPLNGGVGNLPANANFCRIAIQRATTGDTSFSYDVGELYFQEADFKAIRADSLDIFGQLTIDFPAIIYSNSGGVIEGDFTIGSGVAIASDVLHTQPSWRAPTLESQWANYSGYGLASGYFKDTSGRVYLRGLVQRDDTGPSSKIFTLPSGYRPSATACIFRVYGYNVTDGTAWGVTGGESLRIESDGDVILQSAPGTGKTLDICLDGISFDTR